MTHSDAERRALWHAIGLGAIAHMVMLRDAAIVDDALSASVLTAIDSVRRGDPPQADPTLAMVATFDERVDSLTPPGAVGAITIARARHDLAATAQRLVLRDRLLVLGTALELSREALLRLADDHVFTLLQVWSGNSQVQPTNLAHFLTGTIAPLGRAARQFQLVYENTARSPLGAGALAGPGFPVDRDETADLLGMEGPVASTFDAVAAVDHLIACGKVSASVVAPIRRLIEELLRWLRADPAALRLDDTLLAPTEPGMPHFRPPAALERLVARARRTESEANTIERLSRELPYGPVADTADDAVWVAAAAMTEAALVAESFANVLDGPIEINRAALARTAGRALVTTGDLADFLMTSEGLPPAAARDIAALTTNRATQEGLEASGITPALIDGAALLVIGRELGVEIERLGSYLAPRRFIEKRTVVGGPAPEAVRETLAAERAQLEVDRRWLAAKQHRIALAAENLEIRTQEILAAAASG